MLWLKNITKFYDTGDMRVGALRDVSFGFRDCEFVAVLGPSGCGKTTLLNIIGGLDRYTNGDLIINGRSTKEYHDSDWDTYRNHSIGFVFQTYNLIPHQTVLSNVELALTLSGVGRAERRKRAVDALKSVGLGDQLNKKPNQMSGGQMQRVAIARALVNNPDILLADEPTGALDTETSIQVMDILRDVAKDRLVIMVTHNPELAEKYATRIVRLLDGQMIDDSMPVEESELEAECEKVKNAEKKKNKKTSMSFITAMSLSLNNLMTKKARTILTSFAGSIGIIGIALILSMSSGFQNYINRVQQDTLSTYPLAIQSESIDMTGLMSAFMGGGGEKSDETAMTEDAIHSMDAVGDIYSTLQQQVKNNDLESFYKYIHENDEKFSSLTSAITYKYDLDLNVYNTSSSFGTIRANPSNIPDMLGGMNSGMSMFMQEDSWNIWSEMIDNPTLLNEQYDVVSGRWPSGYNEVVLVVGENNGINVLSLYTLGILDQSILAEQLDKMSKGEACEPLPTEIIKFEDIICSDDSADDEGWRFNLVVNSDYFVKNNDGTYTDMSKDNAYVKQLAERGEEIRVVGIIRPSESAVAGSINGAIGYTSALTRHLIDKVDNSDVVNSQRENKTTDIFTGMPFKAEDTKTDAEKKEAFLAAVSGFSAEKRAAIMKTVIAAGLSDEEKAVMVAGILQKMDKEEITTLMMSKIAELQQDTAKFNEFNTKYGAVLAQIASGTVTDEAKAMEMMMALVGDELISDSSLSDAELSAQLDSYILTAGDEMFVLLYDNYCLSSATYEKNLQELSVVNLSSPSEIYIYPSDFTSKESLAALIEEYNNGQADESGKITYTDYIGLFISSISTIIDTISYVLIGFVSISLVVSSIMIGVITYISVLERTKEIGILRSIGASKHDIRMVFNAETFIIGGVSGLLGIGVTLLMVIPINIIIKSLSGIVGIASLPFVGGAVLVLISIILTVVAGLIPSGLAARRDPVVALRTE